MRRILIIVAALLVAVPLILFAVLNFIPDQVIRDRITAAVRDATGRELTISGKLSKSLFPQIGVTATDVSLSNAPGFSGPTFATMQELEARLALLPLIRGKVEVARFVLVEPSIALEVDRNGNNNWTFAPAAPAEGQAPEAAGQTETGTTSAALANVSLGDVKLVKGRVSMFNQQTGERWDARDINVAVMLQNIEQPLTIDGDAVWKDERVALTLKAESPRKLLSAEGSPVSLKVASDLLKANFTGTASNDKALKLAGATDVDVSSVRKLMAWLAEPMAAGGGFGPLAIKGNLAYADNRANFDDAEIKFDGIAGKGALSADLGGAKPLLKGKLAVDTLDLNPYIGGPAAPAASGAASSTGGGAPAAPAAPAASTPAGTGWSNERIDLSGLKAFDADLAFQAKKILFQKMSFADSALGLAIKNGVLTADLSKIALYGGAGKARITVNGAGSVPEIATDLAFNAVAIEPLLRDAASFQRLTGTGNLTLSVTGRGASQKAIAESLNGKGALRLADGAIRGINLASMVRNVAGAFTGTAVGGDQKTDFAELGGTYTITNGMLNNPDLQLLNPLIRLTGSGKVNIGARTVDYRIVPRAVASIEGQGGKTDLTGISVPVRVSGSWDNLKYAPDAGGLLEGAFKGLTEAKEGGEDPLKGALKGLLGQPGAKKKPAEGAPPAEGATAPAGAEPAPAEGAPAPKQDPAEQLLKGIFGDKKQQ